MSNYDKLDTYIDKNLDTNLEELKHYVRQPSISAQNIGLRECAAIVKEMLEKRGFEAKIMDTDGAPVVLGSEKAKRTRRS